MTRLDYLFVQESVDEDEKDYIFISEVGDQKDFDGRSVTRIR